MSTADWNCDPAMEDPKIFHLWDLSSVDELITTKTIWEDIQDYSLSSECYSSYPDSFSGSAMDYSTHSEKLEKLAKMNPCSNKETKSTSIPHASSPTILYFGCPDSPSDRSIVEVVNREEEMKSLKLAGASVRGRPPSYNQGHVISERMRREKLTQKFIALSAMVPDLKKLDKASILGDAIEYMKKLQEKVKTLEEQDLLVDKSKLLVNGDGNSSCDKNFEDWTSNKNHPEIEVWLSEKSILVKIHCENHKGVLVKALSEIENLHLTVTHITGVPFAGSSLTNITVMARIEEKFSMTTKDIVKKLSAAVREFIISRN